MACESALHVISDAAAHEDQRDAVARVRDYVATIKGFGSVVPHFSESNLGAKASTLGAIGDIFSRHDRLIFLEDDVAVSRHFLRYMNEGLARFQEDPRVLAVCSYRLPFKMPLWYRKDVFLGRRYSPWGVGLWRDKWNEIDLSPRDRFAELLESQVMMRRSRSVGGDYIKLVQDDSAGRIDAIDVRVCHHQLSHGQFCVFPRVSLSTNRGFDGTGMHCAITGRFDAAIDERPEYSIVFPSSIRESPTIARRFRDFQDNREGFIKESLKLLRRAFGKVARLVLGRKPA